MRVAAAGLLTLLVSAAALAQPTFGVKAGLNVATLSGIEDGRGVFDTTPRLGVAAGAYLRYTVAEPIAVQAEALYAQKGVRREARSVALAALNGSAQGTESTRLDYHVDYVEVPVLLRYAPDVSPTLDVGMFAGPAVALKVSESLTERFGDEESVYAGTDDLFKSTDVGVVVGGDIGSGPFAVDLRYTFGLTSVNEERLTVDSARGGSSFLFGDVKNGVFTAAFVYRIGE